MPLGAAVVIDEERVLTCAHVVISGRATREPLWIAFPKADNPQRFKVAAVKTAHSPPVRDLAVLTLEDQIPSGVDPAPLRFPTGNDLVRLSWWSFGFPDGDPLGNAADGQVGASLAYGWVRLDTRSPYPVGPGFSGGGLWSPEYQAVVGVVGQAHWIHRSSVHRVNRTVRPSGSACGTAAIARTIAPRCRPVSVGSAASLISM
jgi:hypothetical protein